MADAKACWMAVLKGLKWAGGKVVQMAAASGCLTDALVAGYLACWKESYLVVWLGSHWVESTASCLVGCWAWR